MPDHSDRPIVAPPDYAERPASKDEDERSLVRSFGPGEPTALACHACGNVEGNLRIWHAWWCSRNGDATSNDELRCGRCGRFTLYIHEH